MINQETLENHNLSDQALENIEALEIAGELGTMFAKLYVAAVGEEPELAGIVIKGVGSSTPGFEHLQYTGGSARHKGANQSGLHELIVNTEDGLDHYRDLLRSRRISAEACASKAGIAEGKITPEQLASFIFLHELGHIVDYEKNAPDIDTRNERRKRDMASLPIPGYTPPQLIKFLESIEGNSWFEDNRIDISKTGFHTKEDIVTRQESSYRALETEDIPDRFAVGVMKKLGIA